LNITPLKPIYHSQTRERVKHEFLEIKQRK